MKQVAVKSGAAIEPVQSQHVTLWAAKDIQQTYLPDVQKLEKFFHTKCAEPIRSGLDKRSTHVVLLKDHAEYEAWCRTMFDLFGKQFDEKDNPGANAHFRDEVLKLPAFYWREFCAISVGELPLIGCTATWRAAWEACTLHNWRTRVRLRPAANGIRRWGGGRRVRLAQRDVLRDRLRRRDPKPGGRPPGVEPAGPTAHGDQPGDAAGRVVANGSPPRCCNRITPRDGRLWGF